MRKKWALVVALALVAIVSFSLGAYAGDPIKIFVNGVELRPDVPAQEINGRTMVPIRFVAEALGAQVSWDGNTNSINISTQGSSVPTQTPTTSPSPEQTNAGLSRSNPLPKGQTLLTPDGFEVSVTREIQGDEAWQIAKVANMFNKPASAGNKYILISVKVKNVSSEKEPSYVSNSDFKLVGSSNKIFTPFEQTLVLPKSGDFKELTGQIYHAGELAGGMHFQIPEGEANMVLIWDKPWNSEDKRYFEVK